MLRAFTCLMLPVFLGCFVAVISTAWGQQPAKRGTVLLFALNQNMASLVERALFLGSADLPLLHQMQDALASLEQKLNKAQDPLPLEYAVSMRAINDEVRALKLSDERSNQANVERIRIVTADLRLKNRYLDSGLGAVPFLKRLLILVEVKTYENGVPVEGYEVSCSPLRDPPEGVPRFTFSSTTNNSKRNLLPGIYNLTLSRSGKVFRKIVEIGEDEQEEQVIKLEVAR